MASVSLRAPTAPTSSSMGAVGAVAAAAPGSLLARGDTPALPSSQPLPQPNAQQGDQGAGNDGQPGAMRPDQAQLARQLGYQQSDAQGLARNWRALVRGHGAQLTSQTLAASAGQLSPALLVAAAQGQVVRHAELATHPDAWRFTVHVGGHAPMHLTVLSDDADPPGGRRKRARAALRLEIVLNDGSVVVIQIDPVPRGLALAMFTPDPRTLAWLKALQPELEATLAAAALGVQRWQYYPHMPAARSRAMIDNAEAAAQMLTPAVFRAAAEVALMLSAADSGPRSV